MSNLLRVFLMSGIVAVAAVVGWIVSSGGSAPPEKQVTCGRMEDDNPLGGGVQMSTEEAERAFAPPVLRPQIDVASDETIDELWVRPSPDGEVYIVYRSGMIVIVRPWFRPTWELARDQIADGTPGDLVRVRAVDVFTVPPSQECFGGNAAFNIGGASVAVINSDDGAFEDVGRATESILETAPSVIAADRALDER